MSEMNQEPEIITLEDDTGEEVPCEVLDRLSVDGMPYIVLAPLDDEDSVMIFTVETDDEGNQSFTPVDDDDLNETVFDYFRAAYDDYEFGDAE